eukprot:SAG31_NODE_4555_length_3143_cov_5.394875_5_plen_151_part_00
MLQRAFVAFRYRTVTFLTKAMGLLDTAHSAAVRCSGQPAYPGVVMDFEDSHFCGLALPWLSTVAGLEKRTRTRGAPQSGGCGAPNLMPKKVACLKHISSDPSSTTFGCVRAVKTSYHSVLAYIHDVLQRTIVLIISLEIFVHHRLPRGVD